MQIKFFDLKDDSNGAVAMEYKGESYTADEFCIRIDSNADEKTDHIAEICELKEKIFPDEYFLHDEQKNNTSTSNKHKEITALLQREWYTTLQVIIKNIICSFEFFKNAKMCLTDING